MSFLGNITSIAGAGMQIIRSARSIANVANPLGFSDLTQSDTQTCAILEGMFDKSGVSFEEIKRRLEEDKFNIEKLQHADVFHFEIIRQAPAYDVLKSRVISSMVQSVELIANGLSAEEVQVGSGFYNQHDVMQSGEVQVTFMESQNGDVGDFLTKKKGTDVKSNGLDSALDSLGRASSAVGAIGGIVSKVNQLDGINIPTEGIADLGKLLGAVSGGGVSSDSNEIIPIDGTYLLPYDYYFSIKLSHLIRNNRGTIEEVIIVGDYILDGNVSTSYSTGDEQYLLASATFKPIQSWES